MKDKTIIFRLDKESHSKLKKLARLSKQPMSAVLRSLIDGAVIREMPPVEYHQMITELHRIGVNMNQIARVANGTGSIDAAAYRQAVNRLNTSIIDIEKAVLFR